MKHNDRISKPKPGFFFPVTVAEAKRKIKELRFEVYDYAERKTTRDGRPDLLFISGDKALKHGFPLAGFRRNGDIAIFSLPDEVFPRLLTIEALDRALEEFSKIDRAPEKSSKETHFFVYRAYIGELGKLTLTKDLLGSRSYLYFERALDPRKLNGEEKVLLEMV